MYMEKPVANGNGTFFMFVQTHKKAALPIIKVGCGFFCCFPVKQSLDSLSAKTLLTLDLKYYEKNSLQI